LAVGWQPAPADAVNLANGASLPYEVLVVATGAALLPGETDGLAEAMAQGKAFTFYEPAGSPAVGGGRFMTLSTRV